MRDLNWAILDKMFPFKLSSGNVETYIYNMAQMFSKSYNGGQWQVDTVRGYDFLVAPDNSHNIASEDTTFQGIMDGRTFGAALTLMLYNRLLWRYAEQFPDEDVTDLSELFYDLRDAFTSNEAKTDAVAIYQFLD
jgi:hypothetical protein